MKISAHSCVPLAVLLWLNGTCPLNPGFLFIGTSSVSLILRYIFIHNFSVETCDWKGVPLGKEDFFNILIY